MSERHLPIIYASAPRGARTLYPSGVTGTIGGWEERQREGLIAYTRADDQDALARDAARYRWLRERDLDAIDKGGVFAGSTPDNVVLSGEDLDRAVDWGMA